MPQLSPSVSLLLIILAGVAFYTFVVPGLSLAPWAPTNRKDLKRVNGLAELKAGERFYELGCGDGRVALHIAKENPEVRVIGIELSPLMYAIAKYHASRAGLPNLEIRRGNALAQNLSDADVIYSFALTRTVNGKLMPKLEVELRPGARFISYAFEIKDEDATRDAKERSVALFVRRW